MKMIKNIIKRNKFLFIATFTLITVVLNLAFHVYHIDIAPDHTSSYPDEFDRCLYWAYLSIQASLILSFSILFIGSIFSRDLSIILSVAVFLSLSIFSIEIFTYYMLLPLTLKTLENPMDTVQRIGLTGFIGIIAFILFLLYFLDRLWKEVQIGSHKNEESDIEQS